VEWLSLDSALFYNLEGLGHLPVSIFDNCTIVRYFLNTSIIIWPTVNLCLIVLLGSMSKLTVDKVGPIKYSKLKIKQSSFLCSPPGMGEIEKNLGSQKKCSVQILY